MSYKSYYLNCFILMLPIIIWNILLSNKLPANYQAEIFSANIPDVVTYGENIFRLFIFVISFLMPLQLRTKRQKVGFSIYLTGLLLYMLSWVLLILFSKSIWSNSLLGFSAPAYTPLVWLLGISLIGDTFNFNLPFKKWIFISASALFLAFHLTHTILVYKTFTKI